jgi:hypothetical protein
MIAMAQDSTLAGSVKSMERKLLERAKWGVGSEMALVQEREVLWAVTLRRPQPVSR